MLVWVLSVVGSESYNQSSREQKKVEQMTPAARGFFKLLGCLTVLGILVAALFWPYVVIWVSDFFGG